MSVLLETVENFKKVTTVSSIQRERERERDEKCEARSTPPLTQRKRREEGEEVFDSSGNLSNCMHCHS